MLKTKACIDREIATVIGMGRADVAVITGEFLYRIMRTLAAGGEVNLRDFGVLAVKKYAGKFNGKTVQKSEVMLRKTRKFRSLLQVLNE